MKKLIIFMLAIMCSIMPTKINKVNAYTNDNVIVVSGYSSNEVKANKIEFDIQFLNKSNNIDTLFDESKTQIEDFKNQINKIGDEIELKVIYFDCKNISNEYVSRIFAKINTTNLDYSEKIKNLSKENIYIYNEHFLLDDDLTSLTNENLSNAKNDAEKQLDDLSAYDMIGITQFTKYSQNGENIKIETFVTMRYTKKDSTDDTVNDSTNTTQDSIGESNDSENIDKESGLPETTPTFFNRGRFFDESKKIFA